MIHIEITIRDEEWPTIKIQVTTPDRRVVNGNAHYSIAASQFEPLIRDACKKAVETLVESKRRRREG